MISRSTTEFVKDLIVLLPRVYAGVIRSAALGISMAYTQHLADVLALLEIYV